MNILLLDFAIRFEKDFAKTLVGRYDKETDEVFLWWPDENPWIVLYKTFNTEVNSDEIVNGENINEEVLFKYYSKGDNMDEYFIVPITLLKNEYLEMIWRKRESFFNNLETIVEDTIQVTAEDIIVQDNIKKKKKRRKARKHIKKNISK